MSRVVSESFYAGLMLPNNYIFRRAGGEGRKRGGGDRRSIDEDRTVGVEPVELGLMQ